MKINAFTLLESLIALMIHSILISLIFFMLSYRQSHTAIINYYSGLMQVRNYLITAETIRLLDSHRLAFDEHLLICQQHRLYLIPGYQLMQAEHECHFIEADHFIYLSLADQSYIIGTVNEI